MHARQVLLVIASVVVVLALAGSAAGHAAQTRLAEKHPYPGQLVDVGGYRLHLYCLGEGSPAVVFDGGAGFAPGLALAHLQQAASAHTRACVYDRAGQGWSDPSPKPRTAGVVVEELHTLLAQADVRGPYVLVGWSYGGLTTRLYAYRYPEEVAGLVQVDASHERQLEVLGGRPSPAVMTIFGLLPGLVRTGLPALVPQWVPRVDGGALPADAARTLQALAVMSPKMAETAVAEMQAIEATFAEVAAGRQAVPGSPPLGELPLVVLMKGRSERVPGLALSPEEQQARWHSLQSDLAAQSTRGELIVAEHSGHNIPYQQPELVLAAIERLVAGAADAP